MKINTFRLLPFAISLFFFSCEEEMSISDFSEHFDQYEPELRIEAILDVTHPMSSVVLIDRTIRVDDIYIYNGIDNDDDWQSYDDENGNGEWDYGEELNDDLGEDGREGDPEGFPKIDEGEGNGKPDQGEPHVDEIDEILKSLNDTSATVILRDMVSNDTTTFFWTETADSFQYLFRDREVSMLPDSFEIEIYSGYKAADAFQINIDHSYKIEIESKEFEKNVEAVTHPVSAARILDFGSSPTHPDTLYFTYGDSTNMILWLSGPEVNIYYITLYQKNEKGTILILSNPTFPLEELKEELGNFYADSSLGAFFLPPVITAGIYELTIYTMNEDLGNYYYSGLAIDDPAVTNLRDKSNNPVMGVFGTWTSAKKIVKIR